MDSDFRELIMKKLEEWLRDYSCPHSDWSWCERFTANPKMPEFCRDYAKEIIGSNSYRLLRFVSDQIEIINNRT